MARASSSQSPARAFPRAFQAFRPSRILASHTANKQAGEMGQRRGRAAELYVRHPPAPTPAVSPRVGARVNTRVLRRLGTRGAELTHSALPGLPTEEKIRQCNTDNSVMHGRGETHRQQEAQQVVSLRAACARRRPGGSSAPRSRAPFEAAPRPLAEASGAPKRAHRLQSAPSVRLPPPSCPAAALC